MFHDSPQGSGHGAGGVELGGFHARSPVGFVVSAKAAMKYATNTGTLSC